MGLTAGYYWSQANGETVDIGPLFNTLHGYVILVILSNYAPDDRSYGSAMSVRLFLTMHMGFPTKSIPTADARLPKCSRWNGVAWRSQIKSAENLDVVDLDFFIKKTGEISWWHVGCDVMNGKAFAAFPHGGPEFE